MLKFWGVRCRGHPGIGQVGLITDLGGGSPPLNASGEVWHKRRTYVISFKKLSFRIKKVDKMKNWTQITGLLSVILSDPPCKHGIARFTTVPFKPLTDIEARELCLLNFQIMF